MRILQLNNTHLIKGGADRVYFNTGKLLQSQGHEVTYFSTYDSENIDSEFTKYFIKVPDRRNSGLFDKLTGIRGYIHNREACNKLEQLIVEQKPELAHLHLFCGNLSNSIFRVLKKYKIPIVQTVHDYRHLCPANALLDAQNKICEKCINRSYYQCTLKRCVDGNLFFSGMVTAEAYFRKYIIDPITHIDYFIFVSDFARRKHIQFDKRFIAKSTHLFNFTDISNEPCQYSKDNRYFLSYGRLSKEKGLFTLLKSASAARVPLKIVGNGPLSGRLHKDAEPITNVQIMGHQSGQALKDLIDGAFFILVPSEWYENNPMTVLEAYASGKPVIGSKIGGIPEIIMHNETGFLFEPGNQEELSRLLVQAMEMDEDSYARMANQARKFAERQFSPAQHYEQLIEIYQKVLHA